VPKFDTIPLVDAMRQTAKGSTVVDQYLGYIRSVGAGQAGRLSLGAGETTRAVKIRLGKAAKVAQIVLTVNQIGEDIYFWPKDAVARRRGGRPRKVVQSV